MTGTKTIGRTAALQDEYRRGFEELSGDVAGRVAAQRSLNGSTAIYHGQVVGMGYLPKLYDMDTLRFLDEAAAATYRILCKVTRHYLDDPDYRALFGFTPLLEHLICLPTGYDCLIPITRVDIFLDEKDGAFWFCEFNTDGSSAMNEDRAICDALALGASFEAMGAGAEAGAGAVANVEAGAGGYRLQAQELFDPWVEEFWSIYRSSTMAVADPTVAIFDYMGSATIHELEEFRVRFEALGAVCLICDVRDFTYTDGVLYGCDYREDHPAYGLPVRVDALYRRAVCMELLEELEAAGPAAVEALIRGTTQGQDRQRGAFALVQAVSDGAVCMIGGFRTHVVHSKQVFTVLHDERTLAFLDPEEAAFVRAHVPYTAALAADAIDLEQVIANREQWIIKPMDGYGSVGVFAGVDFTPEAWADLIHKEADGHYVVQTYCRQYQTPNTRPLPVGEDYQPLFSSLEAAAAAVESGQLDPLALAPYNTLTGMYLYGGRFCGTYIRAGREALIVGFHGGVALGSLLVDYDVGAGLGIRPREL